ncbi:hypothetical protein ACP3TY_18705 [Pseudomonas rustica]|uniref:hypothetical protein n=1 Tax=Pseudomonas rustica TaxID=2827099 RepID=UPI003CF5C638
MDGNTGINIDDYEDFEEYEIIEQIDLASVNSTLVFALAQINPIAAAILQTALAGLSPEKVLALEDKSQIPPAFLDYLKEASEAEQDEWNSISRIGSYTSILFNIYNNTNEVFTLRHANWDHSNFATSDFDIQPMQHMNFTLRHEVPVVKVSSKTKGPTTINHGFSFASESYGFEFSTLLKLKKKYSSFSFSPPTIPHREHKIASTGRKALPCSSKISRALPNRPYSYAVAITLG